MSKLFRADNPVFEGIGKLCDLVGLSVLWVVCSAPLFTLGAASAALYDCTVRCVRKNEDDAVYSRFFRVFRANFRVGAFTSLLLLLLAALLFVGSAFLAAQAEQGLRFAYYAGIAYRALILLCAGASCWLFPLLSRYTFNTLALCKTACAMTGAHFPSTLAMFAMTALSAAACAFWFLPLAVLPAVNALCCSFFIERAFGKHEG